VCGICGKSLRKWTAFSRGKKHLDAIHQWGSCNRDKDIYGLPYFRQHLEDAHQGVPGWWQYVLERNAKCKVCSSCLPDAATFPPRHHHDDTNPGDFDVVQEPSSNVSRKSSMRRVHSDVSEYDAQGSLLRRTITDSYTSTADTAAPPLQRQRSSTGSQPRDATRGLMTPHLSCFRCPGTLTFPDPMGLTVHLCTEHPSIFAEAWKHRRLKQAYRRQKKQLRWALDLLNQDLAKAGNTDARNTLVADRITQTLKELDLDYQPTGTFPALLSDAEDSDSEDNADEDSKHEPPPGLLV
jgi:hypothetical protein